MEFLIRKTTSNSSKSITLDEMHKKLELTGLKKDISNNTKLIQIVQKIPKITKKLILDLLIGEFLVGGEPINLVNVPSIEKNKTIEVGTIYFNTKTDNLRLKKKSGWVTINIT